MAVESDQSKVRGPGRGLVAAFDRAGLLEASLFSVLIMVAFWLWQHTSL